jgi:tetratricopeptide (TPR) repeat protein
VARVTAQAGAVVYSRRVHPDAALADPAQQAVRNAVKLTREGHLAEALTIFEEHLAGLTKGTPGARRLAGAAFSYFGVCLAAHRKKYAEAVQYCEISLRINPLDPEHRTNLALVYLERDERERAFETLNAGLRLDRKNRRINLILDSLGRRRPPVVPFLSRQNPINIWLGRRRAEIRR